MANVQLPLLDPERPVLWDLQSAMLLGLDTFGVLGVMAAIKEWCQTHRGGNRAFSSSANDKVLEDLAGQDCYTYRLLMQHPRYILRHLIVGDLAHAAATDPSVAAYVARNMKNANEGPGVYVMYLCVKAGASGHQDKGRFLSADMVKDLCGDIRAYLGPPSPVSNTAALRLDTILQPLQARDKLNAYTPSLRRWAPSPGAVDKMLLLASTLEQRFVTGCSAQDVQQHCPWKTAAGPVPSSRTAILHTTAPAQVGYSNTLRTRLLQQQTCRATSYPFGFLRCWSLIKYPTQFVPQQMVLFRIWKKADSKLRQLAEIVGSLLAGSYIELGGLNCTFAGGSIDTNTSNSFQYRSQFLYLHNPLVSDPADNVRQRMDTDFEELGKLFDNPHARLQDTISQAETLRLAVEEAESALEQEKQIPRDLWRDLADVQADAGIGKDITRKAERLRARLEILATIYQNEGDTTVLQRPETSEISQKPLLAILEDEDSRLDTEVAASFESQHSQTLDHDTQAHTLQPDTWVHSNIDVLMQSTSGDLGLGTSDYLSSAREKLQRIDEMLTQKASEST